MLSTSIFYHLCAFILPSGLTSYTRIQYSEQLSAPLTSFLLYEENIYVGGVNRIYVLDKDLKQIQIANTCESPFGVCSRNVNKILLVQQSERFHVLVSCGTGNSGVCEARNLSNIKNVLWSSSASLADNNYLTVSTNENRPAVGFITKNGIFFVAVTFGDGVHFFEKTLLDGSTASIYNFAISARKLYHFKPIRYGFKEKLLRIQIPSAPVEEFLIYYKACFQYNGMSYFVTNQKNEVGSSTYVTKLVRICQNDTYFNTYTDIVLNCNHFDVTYNLIQDAILVDSETFQGNSAGVLFIAVFTRGNNPEEQSGDSVLCISKITDIDAALDAAQLLYSTYCTGPGNESTRYLPSYKKVGECQRNKDIFEYLNQGCKTPKMYSNVLSKDPINIEANFISPNVSGTLTTLAGATYENKTVILFGTTAGIILQTVLLQNYTVLENYKMTIDPGNEIKKIYAIGEETVYVMSSKKVVKYATTNCSEFESCEDVVKGKHPLCGWCVYEQRATRRHVCSNYTDHWISSFENCLSMSVAPHAVPLSVASNSSNTKVIVRIKNFSLRDLDNVYLCMFSMHSNNHITNADDLDNTTFSCSLPIFAVHGDVKIELLVKTQTGFEASLSSASILIYDCRQYKRCMECFNTKFVQCNWCGQDASCQEPKSGCPSPISIIGECPHLLNNKGNFLPLGTRSVLSFRIANPINSTGVIYRCMLHAYESVIATLNGDFLSCHMQVSQIRHGKKKEKLKIVITYGPRIDYLAEIDDLFANSVTVYRCEQMALDCSHCQALNKVHYSCYWDTNNECVHDGATRVSSCPPPNITKIKPTTGPIYGGTYVTIYGSNLGRTMLDTETITVANVTCDLMNDTTIKPDPDFESLVPSRLICKTGSSSTAAKGAVAVVVEGNLSNTNIEFSYKSPSVFNIYPNFGPKAGGTKITIYGENLAIGNKNISLFLGNHRCEEIIEVTEDRSDTENDTFVCVSKCSMSAPCSSNITELHLSIDGNYVDTNKKLLFSFVDDPVVVQISPLTAFASGGRLLTIEGNLLNNAHSSSIKLSYKGEIGVANCEIVSDTNAVCEIPEAPRALKEQLSRQLSSVTKEKQRCYGRINVSTEINFDAVVQNFIISYTNDPMFDILPDDRNVLTFDATAPWIVISGKCFNTIHKDFDIDIKVGDKTCKIINMTQTVISCVAPTVKPRVTSGNKHPEISVTVGNIQVTVGYLRYIPDEQEENPTMLILYISIAAFFSCIVFSGTICLCRRYMKLKYRVTYLEGKKPGLQRRQNERRQIVDRTISFRQSDIYDEINDEDVLDESIDIIDGANGDEIDDYLVPHPYDDIDGEKTFGHIRQSQRETYALDNINKGSVNLDQAYIHAINDVAQDVTRHDKPIKVTELELNVLASTANKEHAKQGEYVVSYSCCKLPAERGDQVEDVGTEKAHDYIVPYAFSQLNDEKLHGDHSNSSGSFDALPEEDNRKVDSNYKHPSNDCDCDSHTKEV